MQTRNPLPTPREFAALTVAKRAEAAKYLEEAQRTENRGDIKYWTTTLRDLDKLIHKYGLGANSNGA